MLSLVGAATRVGRRLGLIRGPGRHRRAAPKGPTLPVGRDLDGLTPWQAEWAQWRLNALPPDDYRAVLAVLRDAPKHARPYVRRALAAGHPASSILRLADALATHSAEWAAQRLRLVDEVPGAQYRWGVRIAQASRTTCGSVVLLVMAAHADPLLAQRLLAPPGDERGSYFAARFARWQRLIHQQSNRFWPRALGTSPWGMARWISKYATGVNPCRIRLVDDGSLAGLASAVAEVNSALDLGDPVPLLLGAALPRHYVLALSRDRDRWSVYEPSSGEVRIVPTSAVRERQLGRLLGFDGVQAVLLPRR